MSLFYVWDYRDLDRLLDIAQSVRLLVVIMLALMKRVMLFLN